jgi:SagB-type dehydrogenase family enzyme
MFDKIAEMIRGWARRRCRRVFAFFALAALMLPVSEQLGAQVKAMIRLPEPRFKSPTSIEEALLRRRSIREYEQGMLSLEDLAQLLWAAQGVTAPGGYRTAPSAGALYPIELYVAVGNVSGVPAGVYRYDPDAHRLVLGLLGDRRKDIYTAALTQGSIRSAQAVLVFTALYERTTGKYGERGMRYAQLEVGHAAQNVYLQCVSLNLGTVAIGAFSDEGVRKAIGAENGEMPLYIMPIGRR